MNVPEKFIVYQIDARGDFDNFPSWTEVPKKNYDLFKGAKRKLAVIPHFHVHVRRWFSQANGWYVTFEVTQGDQRLLYTDPIPGSGADATWVNPLLTRMWVAKLLPEAYSERRRSTLFLREELNIDYYVEDVKKKALL